jgi:hypothetical protein
MVWAAEFVRAMTGMSDDDPGIVHHAARRACQAVNAARCLDRRRLTDDEREMLDDVLSEGDDR